MSALHALVIGVLQGFAVIPGISRSGVTITGGILLGLKRELAARFSLLISIPAILGATLLEVSKLEEQALPPFGPYVAGMVIAAASAMRRLLSSSASSNKSGFTCLRGIYGPWVVW